MITIEQRFGHSFKITLLNGTVDKIAMAFYLIYYKILCFVFIFFSEVCYASVTCIFSLLHFQYISGKFEYQSVTLPEPLEEKSLHKFSTPPQTLFLYSQKPIDAVKTLLKLSQFYKLTQTPN